MLKPPRLETPTGVKSLPADSLIYEKLKASGAGLAGMLDNIHSYARSYAEVISRVTGIDVEIVDNRMVRIAGTGIYAAGVGSNIAQAGEIYKDVMRTRATVLIPSPREHEICMRCPDRAHCQEHLSLSTPITLNGSVLGVIGLVCFNEAERRRVLDSRESYTAFIGLLADSLARKAEDNRRLDQATRLLDLILQGINVNQQGVLVFDAEGALTYSSKPARALLDIEEGAPLALACLHRTGDSLSDYEDFEITLPGGRRLALMGHLAAPDTPEKVTLFTFDLPNRVAQRVGSLSAGGSGTGLDAIIGQSPPIRALKEKAAKLALSTSTVLITGESGTGKELLARAIHQAGPRRDSPFVAINCGAIPDTLLESELFGYVGGAFTGASSKGRMGKFELAQGGVIFLDEISTMPLYLQVKLLRVLQDRSIIRLGSNRLIKVDVRIIAASNDDLWACTRQNTFREDLYYRLNVIPLTMPTLRERLEDIPVLAEYFLAKYCALFGKSKPFLSPEPLSLLERYPWPGNVRELEHAMEYAVNMMPDGGPLLPDCLPARLVTAEAGPAAPPPAVESVRAIEERAIRAALAMYGQSTEGKRRAAAALGLSLATLYRKIANFSK